jgi:hypothetical protein
MAYSNYPDLRRSNFIGNAEPINFVSSVSTVIIQPVFIRRILFRTLCEFAN